MWITIQSGFSHKTIADIAAVPNVAGFRFNITKEKDMLSLAGVIAHVRQIAPSLKVMVDFGGQKKRISLRGATLPFVRGQNVNFVRDTALSADEEVGIPEDVFRYITSFSHIGEKILISDGWQQFEIVSIQERIITCRALHDGTLHHRRGISITVCTTISNRIIQRICANMKNWQNAVLPI